MKIFLIKLIKKFLDFANSRNIFTIKFNRLCYTFLSKYVLEDMTMEWYRPSIIFTKEDFTTTPELVEIIADSSKLAAQKILKCNTVKREIVFHSEAEIKDFKLIQKVFLHGSCIEGIFFIT